MNKKKIKNNIWAEVTNFENVLTSYFATQKGPPRLKISAIKYKEDYVLNLINLRYRILNYEYYPKSYISFIVREPKVRLIYAPVYEDKIVQHMINFVLREIYEQLFIYDSYACIRNKGTHAAVKRIQYFQQLMGKKYEDPYLLKLDISKFFYTIDREILKTIIMKKIKCIRTLNLIFLIIDNFHEIKGLPLGNLTSQLFANIYLNEIDQLIKRKYKVKYYVRYADDMFLILPSREKAKQLKNEITNEIKDLLKLTINPKKAYIVKANRIVGLGFNIYPAHITLLSRNKRKFRKYLKDNKIKSLNSWYGHAKLANCHSFIYRNIQNSNVLFDGKNFTLRKGLLW